jgi:hypothetical protein
MFEFKLLRGRDWLLVAAFLAIGFGLLSAWIYWLI